MALHWVGPDGTILRANRAELELLGYSPDEYIGHQIAEFHADQDVIGDILRRLQRGEELREVEARLRCKDGSVKHVLISSNVLWEDGKLVHTRCFTRDITDRKPASGAPRRQTDLFTTLVEHIPDIVSRLDRDLRFLYISPAVTPITGRPWQEYIGKPRTNQGLPPEYVQARDQLSRKVFETGQKQRLEFPMLTPAGRRFMESRLIPEFAADGSVESLMTLVRDVTEQKRAEERARLLWEAAAVLLTANDPDGMLRELFARIGPHVGVDVYFNHVVDESGDALRLASCEGIAVDTARAIARLEFGQAVAGTVALRRQPIVVTSIQQSDDAQVRLLKSFGIRACVCHPLVAETRAARHAVLRQPDQGPLRARRGDLPRNDLPLRDRRLRAAAAAERAEGGRPPQGRVPGDAGPRAAEPARPAPQRRAAASRRRAGGARASAGAGT